MAMLLPLLFPKDNFCADASVAGGCIKIVIEGDTSSLPELSRDQMQLLGVYLQRNSLVIRHNSSTGELVAIHPPSLAK